MTPTRTLAECRKCTILAIDPGSEESAFVVYDARWRQLSTRYGLEDSWYDDNRDWHERWAKFGKWKNDALLEKMRGGSGDAAIDVVAIEMIASYGMPVGREVFETCVWIGRFMQRVHYLPTHLIYRGNVKLHLCGNVRAKDAHIRQALIDRFGPGRDRAVGTKKAPGPLYGVSADVWSALAVAVTFADIEQTKEQAA